MDWISKDLKFTNREEAQAIAKVLNRGQTKKIFEYLSQRVKLKTDIEVIRGNLKLQEITDQETIEDDNDDESEHEIKILKKSLKKSKSQIVQLEHDIERSQKINLELSSTQDELKAKITANLAKTQQLTDHYNSLFIFMQSIEKSNQEMAKWSQSKNEFSTSKDTKPILNFIETLRPKIEKVLKHGEKIEITSESIENVNPQVLLQGLLESTRKTELKVNEALEKSTDKPISSNVGKVLEELYEQHIDSYKATVIAEQKYKRNEAEIQRLSLECFKDERDESLKRFILLKQTKKSAEVMLQFLKHKIQDLKIEDTKSLKIQMSIKNGFETMDKQTNEISIAKLFLEDLIGQNSGFDFRVAQALKQVQDQRDSARDAISTEVLEKSKNMPSKAINFIYDPKIMQSISIDRLATQSLHKVLNFSYKPNICEFMKTVHLSRMEEKLLESHLEEMQEFQNFNSDKKSLEILHGRFMADKKELMDLISRKLTRTEKETDYCEKFLHAVKIFVNEPAKDVYMKEIKKEYKGKTLEEWYTVLKSQN